MSSSSPNTKLKGTGDTKENFSDDVERPLLSRRGGEGASGEESREAAKYYTVRRDDTGVELSREVLFARPVYGSEGLATSTKMMENESHYQMPHAKELTLKQIWGSSISIVAVLTAWLYVGEARRVIPHCREAWPQGDKDLWNRNMCTTTVALFRTLPLGCCLWVAAINRRDLLHTRLWYEMFGRQVLLDFANTPFLKSWSVGFFLLWVVLAASMYYWDGKEMFQDLLGVFPFWFPIYQFLASLYSHWDLESRLLSVPKLVEKDPHWAMKHHANCFFIREAFARAAFNRLTERLEKEKTTIVGSEADTESNKNSSAMKMTTGELISALIEEAEKMRAQGEKPESGHEYHFERRWVRELLFHPQLDDERSRHFRHWSKIFDVYTGLVMFALAYLLCVTLVMHLVYEHMVSQESWIAYIFMVHWLAPHFQ